MRDYNVWALVADPPADTTPARAPAEPSSLTPDLSAWRARRRELGPIRDGTGVVVLVAGLGIAVQACGDVLARNGRVSTGVDLLLIGVALIVASGAWRLCGRHASRGERLRVTVALGLLLAVSDFLASPLLFSNFDDLLHQASYWHLADWRTLSFTNSLLQVSPHYPGLELLTVAVKWTTGLPLVASELAVVLLARLVLMLGLYVLGERVGRSPRAGGLFVVIYVCSPQFYAFNSSYSYQTLALAFATASIVLMLGALDGRAPGRNVTLALVSVAGAIVTHHLVGALIVVFMLGWWLLRALDERGGRAEHGGARRLAVVAFGGLAALAAWTVPEIGTLYGYLQPIAAGALSGMLAVIDGSAKHHALFTTPTGRAPLYQEAFVVASVLLLGLLALGGLVAAVFKRTVRRAAVLLLPVLATLGFGLVLLAPVSSGSSQVGQRSSTFVFFGVATLGAAWIMTWPRRFDRVLVPFATVCFIGSLVFGSGPTWLSVPGPFLAGGDQRAITAPSIAAADWASVHLPAGSRVATDRDLGALLAGIGHLSPISESAGQVNPGLLFYDPVFGNFETDMIRKYDIRYIAVDDRDVGQAPALGEMFEPGAPSPGVSDALTEADVEKFATASGLQLIYSNGSIDIYDTDAILGDESTAATTAPITGGNGWNLWALLPFALCVALGLARLATRQRRPSLENGFFWLVLGMAGSIAAMFALVPSKIPATPVVVAVVVAFAAIFARGLFGDLRQPRSTRRHLRLELSGLAVAGVLFTGAAIAMDVASASAATHTVTSVGITAGPQWLDVEVTEPPSASGMDHLLLVDPKGTVWRSAAIGRGTETLIVPADGVSEPAELVLRRGNETIDTVALGSPLLAAVSGASSPAKTSSSPIVMASSCAKHEPFPQSVLSPQNC